VQAGADDRAPITRTREPRFPAAKRARVRGSPGRPRFVQGDRLADSTDAAAVLWLRKSGRNARA
jgi:hypothetical protein